MSVEQGLGCHCWLVPLRSSVSIRVVFVPIDFSFPCVYVCGVLRTIWESNSFVWLVCFLCPKKLQMWRLCGSKYVYTQPLSTKWKQPELWKREGVYGTRTTPGGLLRILILAWNIFCVIPISTTVFHKDGTCKKRNDQSHCDGLTKQSIKIGEPSLLHDSCILYLLCHSSLFCIYDARTVVPEHLWYRASSNHVATAALESLTIHSSSFYRKTKAVLFHCLGLAAIHFSFHSV